MKVRCVKVVSETTGAPLRKSPWLTVGALYNVLTISADPEGQVLFRLVGNDDAKPGLFSSKQFEIVDGSLPTCWRAKSKENGGVQLAPVAWLRDGFWERYFDGERTAIEEFQEGCADIERDRKTLSKQ
jgi:hypothetical protein